MARHVLRIRLICPAQSALLLTTRQTSITAPSGRASAKIQPTTNSVFQGFGRSLFRRGREGAQLGWKDIRRFRSGVWGSTGDQMRSCRLVRGRWGTPARCPAHGRGRARPAQPPSCLRSIWVGYFLMRTEERRDCTCEQRCHGTGAIVSNRRSIHCYGTLHTAQLVAHMSRSQIP